MSTPIFIGQADEPVYLLSNMANRHGLVAGATGTGKTVTLQELAEGFSDIENIKIYDLLIDQVRYI